MESKKQQLEERSKIYVEIIKNIKRKRPIKNQRLDSFSWWVDVEFAIQNELLSWELEKMKEKK